VARTAASRLTDGLYESLSRGSCGDRQARLLLLLLLLVVVVVSGKQRLYHRATQLECAVDRHRHNAVRRTVTALQRPEIRLISSHFLQTARRRRRLPDCRR